MSRSEDVHVALVELLVTPDQVDLTLQVSVSRRVELEQIERHLATFLWTTLALVVSAWPAPT